MNPERLIAYQATARGSIQAPISTTNFHESVGKTANPNRTKVRTRHAVGEEMKIGDVHGYEFGQSSAPSADSLNIEVQ